MHRLDCAQHGFHYPSAHSVHLSSGSSSEGRRKPFLLPEDRLRLQSFPEPLPHRSSQGKRRWQQLPVDKSPWFCSAATAHVSGPFAEHHLPKSVSSLSGSMAEPPSTKTQDTRKSKVGQQHSQDNRTKVLHQGSPKSGDVQGEFTKSNWKLARSDPPRKARDNWNLGRVMAVKTKDGGSQLNFTSIEIEIN